MRPDPQIHLVEQLWQLTGQSIELVHRNEFADRVLYNYFPSNRNKIKQGKLQIFCARITDM
jgi:hypothetical protein